jgi:hypothetical protein
VPFAPLASFAPFGALGTWVCRGAFVAADVQPGLGAFAAFELAPRTAAATPAPAFAVGTLAAFLASLACFAIGRRALARAQWRGGGGLAAFGRCALVGGGGQREARRCGCTCCTCCGAQGVGGAFVAALHAAFTATAAAAAAAPAAFAFTFGSVAQKFRW